jgi:hypothetical protein
MLAGPSQAQSNDAYLYIAHSVPGRNVSSTTNPEFPVDVTADGTCIVKGESFGEILGPFSLAAGSVKFDISRANTVSPCSNSPIYSASASLSPNANYFGVLSLNSSNAVTAQLFGPNFSGIVPGWSRVMIANVTGQNLTATLTSNQSLYLNIPANSAVTQNVISGQYAGTVTLEGTTTMEAGPDSATLMSRNFYFWVLTGSATNNSVQIVGPKIVRDIH